MAVKVPITVEGNLAADPEIGSTKNGDAYARMLIVENDRRYNEESKQWEDAGEPIFHNTVVFGRQAHNVGKSLRKGDAVLASGDLHFQTYEKDGQRRQATQVVAKSVGPSLRFTTVDVDRSRKVEGPDVSATGPIATADAWAGAAADLPY